MLASGLMSEGMNWWQAVLTVFLGNLIVLVPMLLVGHAGAKHGIPYPVLARASFGVYGARLPAILRAIVACGWFGIQTWLGGQGDLRPDRARVRGRYLDQGRDPRRFGQFATQPWTLWLAASSSSGPSTSS